MGRIGFVDRMLVLVILPVTRSVSLVGIRKP